MAKLPFPPRITRLIARLLRDCRGATAVMLAIALTSIIGFAGLGTEVGAWYFTQRAMQGAADFAATSAAAQLAAGTIAGSAPTNTQLTDTGRSVAAKFTPKFIDGDTSNTSVTINNPPATTTNLSTCSSPFSSFNCYVEVLISQPQTGPRISSLFMSSGPTIATRAVARANTRAGDTGCVLALSGASISDVTLNGGVNMSFSNCALYDNSPLTSGNDALYMSNNAQLSASAVYVVGNANNTSGITTTDGPNGANSIYTGVNPAVDPYASVTMPTPTSCDQNNNNFPPNNASTTVGPSTSGGTYVFCRDVALNSTGTTLNLNAGTYIFACGSNLTTNGGNLNATGGVTLVFERACPGHNPANSPGVVNLAGNSNLNITAPTSGATAGIAIFQERYPVPASTTCNGSNCNSLAGTGTLNITGAAYFPNNPVAYSGGSGGGGASQCTQLVANTITFSGNATFNNNCTGTGVRTIDTSNGTLVM